MTDRPWLALAVAVVAFASATTLIQAKQIRRQPGAPVQVALEVSLKTGGGRYDVKAQGSCTHAPKASIYGVLAEMWSVRQEADGRSVQLTLWKPSDGSASMFSLSLNAPKSTTITTVRGGKTMGSGIVTLAASGKGGTFTIDAKTGTGEAITGAIRCEAFTPANAEGGN
jgi:hypothetical protein